MEIRDNKNICIFAPISSKIDKYKTERIFEKIEKEERVIGIDLAFTQDCSIDFIEKIKSFKEKNIGIFNIPSNLFVIFNIMGIDKYARLYVSELDFEENARQIINRKFVVI